MLWVNGHHREMRQLASGLLGTLETGCMWLIVVWGALLSHALADALCTVLLDSAANGTLVVLLACASGSLAVSVLLLVRGHLLLAQELRELRLVVPLPPSTGQFIFASACCT